MQHHRPISSPTEPYGKIFTAFLMVLYFLGSQAPLTAQNYKVVGVGFYNLENLFHPSDDPDLDDEEFTATGEKLWGPGRYQEKLDNMARVIKEIGTELTPDGLAVLGVSEVENRLVLEDLAEHPDIADRNYKVIHFDSPDERGIDVGLMYQPSYLLPLDAKPIRVNLEPDEEDPDYTRDILYVKGEIDGEIMHFFVNHWPSRGGGTAYSEPKRVKAALTARSVIDSLLNEDRDAKIVLMGDLNDDPVSKSVRKVLRAERKRSRVGRKDMYNTLYDRFLKGFGTLAYRDAWNLFDHLIISPGLLDKGNEYYFHSSHIFKRDFMLQKTGKWKGYPLRTFGGDNYLGGYSDHFPVYLFLVRPVDN